MLSWTADLAGLLVQSFITGQDCREAIDMILIFCRYRWFFKTAVYDKDAAVTSDNCAQPRHARRHGIEDRILFKVSNTNDSSAAPPYFHKIAYIAAHCVTYLCRPRRIMWCLLALSMRSKMTAVLSTASRMGVRRLAKRQPVCEESMPRRRHAVTITHIRAIIPTLLCHGVVTQVRHGCGCQPTLMCRWCHPHDIIIGNLHNHAYIIRPRM